LLVSGIHVTSYRITGYNTVTSRAIEAEGKAER